MNAFASQILLIVVPHIDGGGRGVGQEVPHDVLVSGGAGQVQGCLTHGTDREQRDARRVELLYLWRREDASVVTTGENVEKGMIRLQRCAIE